MRSVTLLLIFTCFITFLFSCGNDKPKTAPTTANTLPLHLNHDTIPGIKADSAGIITITQGHYYSFEPDIAVITGTLKVELYYDCRNMGDDSSVKPTEAYYLFYPADTINVIQRKEVNPGQGDRDFTWTGIDKFQLAPSPNLDLHPFINKKIKITGCFYGQFSCHHVTPVLLSVYAAEEVK